MDIQGENLIRLLTTNTKRIQLRSGRNLVRLLSALEALEKARSGYYIGVGSPSRVRYICLAERIAPVRPLAPSCSTRRLRDEAGVLVAAPLIVEHKVSEHSELLSRPGLSPGRQSS